MPTSLRLLLIGVALGSGVFLAWQTAGALLMIFGGLLLAALLDVTCPPEMFPNFGRVCFSRGRTNEAQQVQR
jgi:hypothetical protein